MFKSRMTRAGVSWKAMAFALLVSAAATPASAFDSTETRAIVRHQVSAEEFAGSGGVWMGRSRNIQYDGSGNMTGTIHLLARAFDADWAAERFSPYTFDYWAESQAIRVRAARIWNNDLTSVDLAKDAVHYGSSPLAGDAPAYEALRSLSVNFPEIEPGQVIELILDVHERVLPGEYNIKWFHHVFGHETDFVIEEQLRLQTPTALDMFMENVGPPIRNRPEKLGGFKAHHWLTGNLEPLATPTVRGFVSSSLGGNSMLPDSANAVIVSASRWPYLSNYIGRFYGDSADQINTDINLKVGDLTRGTRDIAEKAKRIELFVQQEIRTIEAPHQLIGIIPLRAEDIFHSGAGAPRDKAALMVGLLRSAGIQCAPVLVRTRKGPFDREIGCPDALDRFLIRTESRDGFIWLDPVESASPLPASEGLFLAMSEFEEESGLVPYPGRPAN